MGKAIQVLSQYVSHLVNAEKRQNFNRVVDITSQASAIIKNTTGKSVPVKDLAALAREFGQGAISRHGFTPETIVRIYMATEGGPNPPNVEGNQQAEVKKKEPPQTLGKTKGQGKAEPLTDLERIAADLAGE